MINGVHALIFGKDADRMRAFFRDVLEFPSVDAGGGWLIFALPPAELGLHSLDGEGEGGAELYLMCADIAATRRRLEGKGVEFTKPVHDEGWGLVTAMRIPGGPELGIYQPKHPLAIGSA